MTGARLPAAGMLKGMEKSHIHRSGIAVTVLLLLVLGGCTSDQNGTDDPPPARKNPAEGNGVTSPPPPSKLERRIIGAFRRVGIDAGISEHGYRDAWIAGIWRGAEILVHAYHVSQADVRAIKSKIVGEAQVGEVRVLDGRNAGFGVVRTFVCRGTEYQVTTLGETPNSNKAIGTFLPAFIDAVRCP